MPANTLRVAPARLAAAVAGLHGWPTALRPLPALGQTAGPVSSPPGPPRSDLLFDTEPLADLL
jgi:hypothetical protein